MYFRLWLATIITSLFLLSIIGCGGATTTINNGEPAMAETATESSAMAESHAMSDTMMMTDTHAMTDSMMMSDTHAMTDSMMMTETQAMTESAADSAMADKDAAMMQDLPAWQTMALTDARTGATFTLADFVGKHVFVETMATWCPNCREQLGNVKSAAARADAAQTVFVAISVETDLPPATLAQYADDNDFPWTFAVATPAMVQALAETFGQTIANPPATPHFILLPDGSHGDLVTGFESGDQLLVNLGQ